MSKAFLALLMLTVLMTPAFAQQPCGALVNLKLPHTTITSAAALPAESTRLPGQPPNVPPVNMPARCEVKVVARPTSDSEIKIVLWLPPMNWNGKYRQLGNGGFAGTIPYFYMIDPLRQGYATAATDDGHEASGTPGSFATGHPEKLIDFGYRAVHETSVQSKAIVAAFYGREASLSYFEGCSDGGREALMEAERFPEDFNGIIAGAPAHAMTPILTGFIWNQQALSKEPGSMIPIAKLSLIQNAALAFCDAADGLKDGLLDDPRSCRFDPSPLLCKGADSPECLTSAQLEALRKIYAGAKNPRTGEQIFPGFPAGTEAVRGNWGSWIIGDGNPSAESTLAKSYYADIVFENPKWDFKTLDFDRDVRFGDEKAGLILNSTNPDLRSFRAHGGKLIQFHGWGDAAISPVSSIEYYDSVRSFLGKFPDPRSNGSQPIENFYRLFMVPGMSHCGGGIGPVNLGNEVMSALEGWVEKGVAPQRLMATGTSPLDRTKMMSRPICAYPQVAKYKGSGDPNAAENFECRGK